MSDRVPIGTLPGLAQDLLAVDVILATLGRAATISRVFLTRSGLGAGALTASVRNATGGGGSGISVVFGSGDASAIGTGSLAVAAGESIYLRISAADAISQDLRGWFEVSGAAGVTTALTNLARVKDWRGITVASFDAILEQVIAGVSAEMQAFMRRRILAEEVLADLYDGPAGDTLTLRAYPILTPAAVVVRESGVVVATTDYVVRAAAGQIVKVSNGWSGAWERGRLNVSVDFDAGFDEVPEDLAEAATRQAAYRSLETPAGNLGRLGNRGTVLPEGGSSEYVHTTWIPGVRETLEAYRDRRVF